MKSRHGLWVAMVLAAFTCRAVSTNAQTQPKSIKVLPANPLVAPGQTQLFTALSVNPPTFGEASALAAGDKHTCALLPNGTVECWGANYSGQLGNGTRVDSDTPVTVSGLTGVTAISAGGGHTCALLANGTVECWGSNSYGELGNTTCDHCQPTASSVPVPVSGLTGVIGIAAGYKDTCALIVGGAVECWGDNSDFELANSSTTDAYAPVPVVGPSGDNLQGAIAIASSAGQGGIGAGHTCALIYDGTVDCWGDNTYGQLGEYPLPPSQAVSVGGLSGAIAISAGFAHTCALIYDGTVKCWGWDSWGQLGDGTTTDSITPVSVAGLSGRAIGIAAGYGHTCALLDNGTAQCWGANEFGELGDGTAVPAPPFGDHSAQTVSGLSGATSIVAGEAYTCALLVDGSPQCWGYNSNGQLGNGSTSDSDVAVAVLVDNLSAQGAVRISANESSNTCALLANGTAECWGFDSQDELGNGATTNSSTPVAMTVLSGMKALANSAVDTCALLPDGTVRCWGLNQNGELGNGTMIDSLTPVQVTNLSGVKAIASGGEFTCALLSDGTVQCWGLNQNGQLGTGTSTDSSTPVVVSGLSGVKAIAAGDSHACALIADGSMQCWGDNEYGALGNGTSDGVPPFGLSPPVAVTGLSGVTAIAAGADHSCALYVNGGVFCWGYNEGGQLGNGNNSDSSTPQEVLSGTLMKSLALSGFSSCTLSADGTAQCWGDNSWGQLGDGTTVSSNTPMAVTGLTGAMSVVAGTYHVCVLLANGTVQCWGANVYGQLGNGTITTSDTPVATNALVPSVAWSSSQSAVATIDAASGLATAVADGSTTITATYGSRTAHTTLTVGIAPAITSASSATFTVGTASLFTVTTTGSPTAKLTKTGALPKGVTFVDNGDGSASLSGTPAVGKGGTYTITITAKNGLGSNATQSFTLTVNEAPSISSAANSTFAVGTAKSFTVAVNGFPVPTLNEVGAVPNGLTFNAATGILSGTAASGTGGTYALLFTASNGIGPDASQNFTLTVDEAPAITSANSATFTVGALGSFTVTATGFPTAKLSKTGTLPKGITFVDNGNGSADLSGTPAAGTAGTYAIAITAKNGVGVNATQSFTLTVQ
ncbi:MAG TPA: putative Ig domain-containing protein [Terriglobales bacterium]|nr:putative Ig domain-containing protein [Terriglobales bacterium]